MKHFNLSNDWHIGTTASGRRVFTPILSEDRDYDPQTDLVLHGKITIVKNVDLKFVRFTKHTPKGFADESKKLFKSFPTGEFTIQFFNKHGVKIKSGKDDDISKALLTLSLPESYKIFKTNHVLVKFYAGGKIHFAMIMNDGDELTVVNVIEEDGKCKKVLETYIYTKGRLELHPAIV